MKKQFSKMICLTVVLSMLLGLNGCAMMIQNVKREDVKQNAQLSEEEVQTEIGIEEGAKEQADNSVANNSAGQNTATETKQPSKAEEALMSEFFVEKMELLAWLIDQAYLYDISVEEMRNGAYKGLMAGLGDPYTCYYTAEEYKDLMESTSGTYYGIGAVVQQNLKTMYITI